MEGTPARVIMVVSLIACIALHAGAICASAQLQRLATSTPHHMSNEVVAQAGRTLLQTCGYVCANYCGCGCAWCSATQYQCNSCGWNVTGNWWVFLVIVLSVLVLMALCSWLTCRYRRRRQATANELAVTADPVYPTTLAYYGASPPSSRIPMSTYTPGAGPPQPYPSMSAPTPPASVCAIGLPAYPIGYPAVHEAAGHYPGPPTVGAPPVYNAAVMPPIYNASDMPPAQPAPSHAATYGTADGTRDWTDQAVGAPSASHAAPGMQHQDK